MTHLMRLTCLVICLLSAAMHAEAASLKVSPARFMVQNVEPGRLYDVYKESGLRLAIFNDDDVIRTWVLSTHRPGERGKWEEGYGEIPDSRWCWFDKQEIAVPAGSTGYAHLFLRIPEEEEYFNQHWVVTLGIGGKPGLGGISLAIDVRMQIETKNKVNLKTRPHGMLGIAPGTVRFENVKPGIDERRFVVLYNNDDTAHSYTLSSLFDNSKIDTKTYLTSSYSVIPSRKWIRHEKEIQIEAKGSTTLEIGLKVPGDVTHFGKKWENILLIKPDNGRAGFLRMRVHTIEKAKEE